jgi:hypothetical protein
LRITSTQLTDQQADDVTFIVLLYPVLVLLLLLLLLLLLQASAHRGVA